MNERGSILVAAVLLAACGGGGTMSMSSDSGPPAPALPVAMVDTTEPPDRTADGPADFSCMGARTAPMPGAPVSFTAHAHDLQGGVAMGTAMVEVQFFANNLVSTPCAGSCTSMTTNDMGNAMFMAAEDAWFAYRIPSPTGGNPVTTIGYNRQVPGMGETVNLPTVSTTVIGLIPTLYMRSRVPGTGVVSGTLADCNGRTVRGARLRLFRGGSEIIPGAAMTDFFVGYFSAATRLPDARATFSDVDGVFASANVAASTDPVRIELWAVLSEGSAEQRVGCEAIQVEADAVSIVAVGPTRSDYPAGHPCGS